MNVIIPDMLVRRSLRSLEEGFLCENLVLVIRDEETSAIQKNTVGVCEVNRKLERSDWLVRPENQSAKRSINIDVCRLVLHGLFLPVPT